MENTMQSWTPRVLSILRIMVGLLFLQHGMSKLFGFPHNPQFDHLQLMSLIGLAGVIETFGGALLALGLFTRWAAFILSGEMAVAYFMAHAPRGFYPMFNNGEAAVLFCFACLYIVFAGGGEWSVDRMRASGQAAA